MFEAVLFSSPFSLLPLCVLSVWDKPSPLTHTSHFIQEQSAPNAQAVPRDGSLFLSTNYSSDPCQPGSVTVSLTRVIPRNGALFLCTTFRPSGSLRFIPDEKHYLWVWTAVELLDQKGFDAQALPNEDTLFLCTNLPPGSLNRGLFWNCTQIRATIPGHKSQLCTLKFWKSEFKKHCQLFDNFTFCLLRSRHF